jgi:hypothetical protein
MVITWGVRVIVCTLIVLHALTACSHAGDFPDTVSYGSKVRFRTDRVVRYPDFQVTYVGKRHVAPPQYPRGWWTFDFKVRGKDGEQTVSWSAGTGDIGPTRFVVNGAQFQIELSRSDKLGQLRDDEMVVSSVLTPR